MQKNEQKKILIVNYAPVILARYELRLAEMFARGGYETTVLHFGRMCGYKDSEVLLEVGNVKIYDFSYFKTRSLCHVLKTLKPNIVVTYASIYLFERIVYDACKILKIKCVCIAHGTMNSDFFKIRENDNSTMTKLKALPKYFRWLVLWGTVLKEQSSLFYFKSDFVKLIIDMMLKGKKVFRRGFCMDTAFVFSQVSKEEFIKNFGYPESKVKVVGNIYFDILKSSKESELNVDKNIIVLDKTVPTILYIAQPFVDDSMFGWNEFCEKKFYKSMVNELRGKYNILFKLHDRMDAIRIKNYFETGKEKINIFQSEPLDLLFSISNIVIGHNSTAIDFAFKYKIPIVLMPVSKDNEINDMYYNHYSRTGWVVKKACFGELDKVLKEVLNINCHEVYKLKKEMVENVIGPLDCRAGERIIACMNEMLSCEKVIAELI